MCAYSVGLYLLRTHETAPINKSNPKHWSEQWKTRYDQTRTTPADVCLCVCLFVCVCMMGGRSRSRAGPCFPPLTCTGCSAARARDNLTVSKAATGAYYGSRSCCPISAAVDRMSPAICSHGSEWTPSSPPAQQRNERKVFLYLKTFHVSNMAFVSVFICVVRSHAQLFTRRHRWHRPVHLRSVQSSLSTTKVTYMIVITCVVIKEIHYRRFNLE